VTIFYNSRSLNLVDMAKATSLRKVFEALFGLFFFVEF